MDVVGLEDAADIGLVRGARAQPFERRLLIAEGRKERIRELDGIERLLGKLRDRLFNLYGIHGCIAILASPAPR